MIFVTLTSSTSLWSGVVKTFRWTHRVETESHRNSIQFSVRTLLIVTANVALLTAVGQISDASFDNWGKLIKAHALLVTIYGWRFVLINSQFLENRRWQLFALILLCSLPYIYVFIGSMFNKPFGLPLSKWLGSPIWIFAVPTCSFLAFDTSRKWSNPRPFVIRSLVELTIVFHVWSFIWVWGQLIIGWAWI